MDEQRVTDLSYLREIAMGDDAIVIETAETFIEDIPSALADIQEYYEAEDWQKLQKLAHKIKPNFTYMGMDEARELIVDIEQQAKSEEVSSGLNEDIEKFVELCEQALDELQLKIGELKNS